MEMHTINSPQEAMQKLILGNNTYLKSCRNPADISPERRVETSQHGQNPYAVVLTCSDSRVPPEHIFSAGIGDLFVVRTAGNVVGDFEIGSIEYGTEHLGAKVVVVMGLSHCDAVEAALEGHAEGYIQDIVHETQLGIHGATNEHQAILNNILHSKKRIMRSTTIRNLVHTGKIFIVCAKYNIDSGKVDFFNW